MFSDMFPYMPLEHEPEALRIYGLIFGDLPLDEWTLEGSRLVRFVNGRKLAFAPRRTHCTVGFIGRQALEFYRFIDGDCPVGEVTIKPPYYERWNADLIADTIEWYLNN